MSEEIKEQTEEILQSIQEDVEFEPTINECEEKLKMAEDKYLRAYAEFENIKKRLEREKYQAIEFASEKFAKDLLAPIDTLEFAIASANSDAEPAELVQKIKEGLELTIKNFKTVFEKHGIELVDMDGDFDPNLHDAVMQVNSEEHNDGQIVQTLQKGYKYKERLLRPAMVSICKK
jgi:molecular chaperone GrpE